MPLFIDLSLSQQIQKNKHMKDLSIIIPAYNEAERIQPTIANCIQYLKNTVYSFEIIVVDDGSTDQTVSLIRSLQLSHHEITLLVQPHNQGKGAAVKRGMLDANGAIRVFMDADESTPTEELKKLLTPIIHYGADISIGSRYLPSSEVTIPQPWHRRVWSRFANQIVQSILLPGIVDPNCGFKAYTAEAANAVFSQCEITQWSFDLEALGLARSMDFTIAEVPVKWLNDERSKGRLSHLAQEINNLFKIKKRIHLQEA
jgi:dolichyl-phosphate beta-glucosyltransferase